MKKLFTDTSQKKLCNNVCVGGEFTSDYSYPLGYWEAADFLVEQALSLSSPFKDRLFYPICFNYRQFIELCLKQLIIFSEEFYRKTEKVGYELKKIEQYHSTELMETHSLEKLLNWLKESLSCTSSDDFDGRIQSLIIEFHNIDPSGEKFRYPISKTNKQSFPDQSHYDLKKIKKQIEKIANYFMGIDSWIDFYTSEVDCTEIVFT